MTGKKAAVSVADPQLSWRSSSGRTARGTNFTHGVRLVPAKVRQDILGSSYIGRNSTCLGADLLKNLPWHCSGWSSERFSARNRDCNKDRDFFGFQVPVLRKSRPSHLSFAAEVLLELLGVHKRQVFDEERTWACICKDAWDNMCACVIKYIIDAGKPRAGERLPGRVGDGSGGVTGTCMPSKTV